MNWSISKLSPNRSNDNSTKPGSLLSKFSVQATEDGGCQKGGWMFRAQIVSEALQTYAD
jgi:hypothetical protein